MRVGIGYDIHRLAEERKLFLGGVEIPYVKGLLGYSDGDVVLHAISDAVLGAIGAGDIGEHFPNTDSRYEGVRSGELVRKVVGMARERGYVVGNVDVTVIAEEPKLYPFKEKMVRAMSEMLAVGPENINVKATTNEGVGSLGKGEAIAAYAIISLSKTS